MCGGVEMCNLLVPTFGAGPGFRLVYYDPKSTDVAVA
jgi:hypothetical protein